MLKKYIPYLWFTIPFFLFSCASHPEFLYLQNLEKEIPINSTNIDAKEFAKIQVFDFLHISVYSIDPVAALPFNPQISSGGGGNSQPEVLGYKIGEDGFLEFPVLGSIKMVGLSLKEAELKLKKEIEVYLKEPVVNIKFLNLKVTVIGEVNKPGTFDLPVENMTILQAIGLASDVTIYGDRTNIIVVREKNGERIIGRLNLLNTEIFNSPFYYLQQNDVIIAQPSALKDTQVNTLNAREILPWVSAGVSFVSLLIAVLR